MALLHWRFGALDVVNYQILFVLSVLLRVPRLALVRRIHEPKARRARVVLSELLSTRSP